MTKEEVLALYREYCHDTACLSYHKSDHPAYLKLVEAGKDILPFVAERLKDTIGHDCGDAMDHDNSPWLSITLLSALTDGECAKGMPKDYAGRLREIRDYFLTWAHKKNLVDYVNVKTVRPRILKILGLSKTEALMEFSEEYHECLCMVVLSDVGPDKMDKVCDYLRQIGKEKLRLCANIIEDAYVKNFEGLDFEDAWKQSWNYTVATVRMG